MSNRIKIGRRNKQPWELKLAKERKEKHEAKNGTARDKLLNKLDLFGGKK